MLPSSQASELATTPSPQRTITWHGTPAGEHAKPGSMRLQSALQPSPPFALPSSQASSAVRSPLPHLPAGPRAADEPALPPVFTLSVMIAGPCWPVPAWPPLPPPPPPTVAVPELLPEAHAPHET